MRGHHRRKSALSCWLKNRLLLNTYLLSGPVSGYGIRGTSGAHVYPHICVDISCCMRRQGRVRAWTLDLSSVTTMVDP